jgi:subfamily B ATP-binding cassette protein MsbA
VKRPGGDLGLYLRLLRYVAPYWRWFALSIASMVIVSATNPAVAALMQPLFDGAFINKDPQAMWQVPILLVAVFVVRAVAGFLSGGALYWLANKVIMDLRAHMYAHLVEFPIGYFNSHTAGGVMSRFTYDVTQIREASTTALTILVRDALAVLALVGWMFWLDWRLSLAAMLGAPAIAAVMLIIRRRLRLMSRKVQDSMGEIHHRLDETIAGRREMKLYGAIAQERERFAGTLNRNRQYLTKLSMAAVASSPAIQLITALALAGIVYLGAQQALADRLTAGGFVSFVTAMGLLLSPLKRLAGINEFLQRGLAAAESVFRLVDTPGEEDTGTRTLARARGAIEFERVSFAYAADRAPALVDVSLRIEPGEVVALVGSSGSGKTTLVNLIPRFYTPTSGVIRIDGIDIREITLQSLRANIALVSQDVVLFNDTVRNNIAYGELRGVSEARLIASAEAAQALDFIRELPQGFDTVLGGHGLTLSGGQRQRLAIARALLKDAPILILDEATAALDSHSERQLQKAMAAVMRGRTCIIIAHRLSTVQAADRIVVLEGGRIVESGAHPDLLHRNGVYARLHRLQFAAASA